MSEHSWQSILWMEIRATCEHFFEVDFYLFSVSTPLLSSSDYELWVLSRRFECIVWFDSNRNKLELIEPRWCHILMAPIRMVPKGPLEIGGCNMPALYDVLQHDPVGLVDSLGCTCGCGQDSWQGLEKYFASVVVFLLCQGWVMSELATLICGISSIQSYPKWPRSSKKASRCVTWLRNNSVSTECAIRIAGCATSYRWMIGYSKKGESAEWICRINSVWHTEAS